MFTLTYIHERGGQLYRCYFNERPRDTAIHEKRDSVHWFLKAFTVLYFIYLERQFLGSLY